MRRTCSRWRRRWRVIYYMRIISRWWRRCCLLISERCKRRWSASWVITTLIIIQARWRSTWFPTSLLVASILEALMIWHISLIIWCNISLQISNSLGSALIWCIVTGKTPSSTKRLDSQSPNSILNFVSFCSLSHLLICMIIRWGRRHIPYEYENIYKIYITQK